MKYMGDQNLTGFYFESGSYGSLSGTLQWLGLVNDFTPDENENVQSIRYQGSANRDVDIHVDGPRDYMAAVSLFPQDFRLLGFAMGSIVDAGSPVYSHTMTAINSDVGNAYTSGTKNPFLSMGLYHAQAAYGTGINNIRRYDGAVVNNWTLSISQGEIISIDGDFIAQNMAWSSGAAASITASSLRPFLWSDSVLLLAGSAIDFKSLTLGLNNNMVAPHYCNGSKVIDVPQPGNRDLPLSVTIDGESSQTKMLFDQFFQGGSEFNAMIFIAPSSGTRDCAITLSGCRLVDMSLPGKVEGTNEQTLTIVPKVITAVAHDSIAKYNAW